MLTQIKKFFEERGFITSFFSKEINSILIKKGDSVVQATESTEGEVTLFLNKKRFHFENEKNLNKFFKSF